MSQKFKKLQNKNDESTAYGKWFATAVYDQRFIETDDLANFIQAQASVKKSDVKAVLDELGGAMKHFFELGQKVKLEGIGTFKVGFSSIGAVQDHAAGILPLFQRGVDLHGGLAAPEVVDGNAAARHAGLIDRADVERRDSLGLHGGERVLAHLLQADGDVAASGLRHDRDQGRGVELHAAARQL